MSRYGLRGDSFNAAWRSQAAPKPDQMVRDTDKRWPQYRFGLAEFDGLKVIIVNLSQALHFGGPTSVATKVMLSLAVGQTATTTATRLTAE